MAFESEKKAKKVAEQRQEIEKEKRNKPKTAISLTDLFNRAEQGEKEINIILILFVFISNRFIFWIYVIF